MNDDTPPSEIPTLLELDLHRAHITRYTYTETQDSSGLVERIAELSTVGNPPIDITEPNDKYIVASVETDGYQCHTTLYLRPPKTEA